MTQEPTVPNLFVVGVPKAGTTSLLRWLGDNPQIGRSTENELRYLMDEGDPLCRADGYGSEGLEGYKRFYRETLNDHGIRYLLDVSPQYYYQKTAQEVIGSVPNSQVIFVLRRPSARIYSLYNYAKNNKAALDAEMGFEDFVTEIRRGEASDILRNRPMLQYAIDHSRYASYVQLWQDIVGPERVHVYLFEDIAADATAMLRQIAVTLGLDPTFYDSYDFPVQNESFALRNRRLHKVLHRSRRTMPAWLRRSLKPAYLYLNTRKPDRLKPNRDIELLTELDAEFLDAELELARLLGRTAPLWPRAEAPTEKQVHLTPARES